MNILISLILAISAYTSAPYFASADDAAKAALVEASQDSRYEFGGLVLQCEAGFTYTAPVTSMAHDRVDYRAQVAKGCKIAGQYHTHVMGNGYEKQFSKMDHESAKALGVPAYMRDPEGTTWKLNTGSNVRKQFVSGVRI